MQNIAEKILWLQFKGAILQYEKKEKRLFVSKLKMRKDFFSWIEILSLFKEYGTYEADEVGKEEDELD